MVTLQVSLSIKLVLFPWAATKIIFQVEQSPPAINGLDGTKSIHFYRTAIWPIPNTPLNRYYCNTFLTQSYTAAGRSLIISMLTMPFKHDSRIAPGCSHKSGIREIVTNYQLIKKSWTSEICSLSHYMHWSSGYILPIPFLPTTQLFQFYAYLPFYFLPQAGTTVLKTLLFISELDSQWNLFHASKILKTVFQSVEPH